MQLDRPYLHSLRGVTFRPVFIIGEHRSGTTILYKLLAATGALNFVRYYHITNYDEILYNHLHGLTGVAKAKLAAHMDEIGLTDRVFDQIRVHPDLPEEYSFILKRHATLLYVPRTSLHNRAKLVELCRKVQVEAGEERPVLLKNPWDSANFLYLRQAFPRARFVFIHRHPLLSINSKLRAVHSILEKRNDYSALLDPAYARLHGRPALARLVRALFSANDLGLHLITRLAKRSARYYLCNIGQLSWTEYTEITYEQLCARPDETIRGVLEFLELESRVPIKFAARIKQRPLNLLPTIAAHKDYIEQQLRPYMSRINYNPL